MAGNDVYYAGAGSEVIWGEDFTGDEDPHNELLDISVGEDVRIAREEDDETYHRRTSLRRG